MSRSGDVVTHDPYSVEGWIAPPSPVVESEEPTPNPQTNPTTLSPATSHSSSLDPLPYPPQRRYSNPVIPEDVSVPEKATLLHHPKDFPSPPLPPQPTPTLSPSTSRFYDPFPPATLPFSPSMDFAAGLPPVPPMLPLMMPPTVCTCTCPHHHHHHHHHPGLANSPSAASIHSDYSDGGFYFPPPTAGLPPGYITPVLSPSQIRATPGHSSTGSSPHHGPVLTSVPQFPVTMRPAPLNSAALWTETSPRMPGTFGNQGGRSTQPSTPDFSSLPQFFREDSCQISSTRTTPRAASDDGHRTPHSKFLQVPSPCAAAAAAASKPCTSAIPPRSSMFNKTHHPHHQHFPPAPSLHFPPTTTKGPHHDMYQAPRRSSAPTPSIPSIQVSYGETPIDEKAKSNAQASPRRWSHPTTRYSYQRRASTSFDEVLQETQRLLAASLGCPCPIVDAAQHSHSDNEDEASATTPPRTFPRRPSPALANAAAEPFMGQDFDFTTLSSLIREYCDASVDPKAICETILRNAPCSHIMSWKRLRAKRGLNHLLCYYCGAKWKSPRARVHGISWSTAKDAEEAEADE